MGGDNPDGAVQRVVRRSPLSSNSSFSNMMSTYYQHGADNLSIWLTNAKDAAAQIREATIRKRKEKKEKYVKFLKDLHLRVAESAKEKRAAASARIPPAKTPRMVQAHSDRNKTSRNSRSRVAAKVAEDTEDLLKQASSMEDVRSFLESQLRKKTRTPTTARFCDAKYRDCMIHAVKLKNEEKPFRLKVRRENKPVVTKENEEISLSPIVKPFVVVIPTPPVPQKPELVMSEPCTPRALDGWNIPTSFSALDMRSVEKFIDIAMATSPQREPAVLPNTKVPPLVIPPFREDTKDQELETFAQKLSARRKNAKIFCREISPDLRMKCCERIKPKVGTLDHCVKEKTQSHSCCGTAGSSRTSPTPRKLRRNGFECRQVLADSLVECPSLRNGDGVTTCSMGVVVLKGREEYEIRGQGKQFFSDVWKCAMHAERRCASERARMLSEEKKKRLEELQVENQQKAMLLRQTALTRQRIAVQTHLDLVATLKARREGVILRNRILEKRRFANALRAIRLEKMQGYGFQVPPLCDCNHGEDPLNLEYIKKCHSNCKLRNNFAGYTAQLETTLQCLLDEISSGLRAQAKEKSCNKADIVLPLGIRNPKL